MAKKKKVKLTDISKNRDKPLLENPTENLMPLPLGVGEDDEITPLTDEQKEKWEHALDGISALNLPKPQTKEEEERYVKAFLNGLEKLPRLCHDCLLSVFEQVVDEFDTLEFVLGERWKNRKRRGQGIGPVPP